MRWQNVVSQLPSGNTRRVGALDASEVSGARSIEQTAMSEEEYSLSQGTQLGTRFVIDTPVGAGAQGEVYRARDVNIEAHRVAIKIMRHPARTDAQREAAMRELELLSAVHHPSVLHFLDYGWHDGRLWFAMPWLEGETLEEHVLSRQAARPVFERLAGGLAALHAVGIRHQDLKPANIFLSQVSGYDDDQPLLLDLGVAVRSGELMAAGSLAYFAPEVAGSWPMPNPKVDEKADVFALALTLREVLEPGTMPELPETDEEVTAFLQARASEIVPPPRGPGLRYLKKHFARWLHVDPAMRPSADEFRRELAVLTLPEERRRRMLMWGAVAAVLLALGAWGVHQFTKAQEFQAESEHHEGRAVVLEGAVEQAGERIDTLEDRVESEVNRAAELGAEASSAKEQAEAAQREAEAAARAAAVAQRRSTRSASAANRARELQAAAEEAAERAARMQRNAQQQADSAEAAAAEADRRRAAAEAARQRAQAQAREASTARDSAEAEARQARTQAQQASSRVEALSAQLAAASREGTQAQARVTQLQAELARAERQAEQARASAQSAQAEAAASARQVSQLQSQVERLRQQVRALQQQGAGGGGTRGGRRGGAPSGEEGPAGSPG